MLRITKLTDYATVLLTALAAAPGRVHSATELAERARLELPTVSKVLKPLAHAGLVESFRGSNGGYRLARAAEDIPLIDIVEAIEGKLGVTECSGEHSACQLESHCDVRGNWRHINQVVADALRGISLAQMRAPMPAAPLTAAAARAARAIPSRLAAE
jgi:FeS assembly SUF system regulator